MCAICKASQNRMIWIADLLRWRFIYVVLSPTTNAFHFSKIFPRQTHWWDPVILSLGEIPFVFLPPHLCAHPLASKSKMGLGDQKSGAQEGNMGASALQSAQLANRTCGQILGFLAPELSTLSMVPHGVWHTTLNTLPSSLTCAFVYLMYVCGSLTRPVTETASNLCCKLPSSISSGWGEDAGWACFEISPLFNEC